MTAQPNENPNLPTGNGQLPTLLFTLVESHPWAIGIQEFAPPPRSKRPAERFVQPESNNPFAGKYQPL
jgi:hypothetical protein